MLRVGILVLFIQSSWRSIVAQHVLPLTFYIAALLYLYNAIRLLTYQHQMLHHLQECRWCLKINSCAPEHFNLFFILIYKNGCLYIHQTSIFNKDTGQTRMRIFFLNYIEIFYWSSIAPKRVVLVNSDPKNRVFRNFALLFTG